MRFKLHSALFYSWSECPEMFNVLKPFCEVEENDLYIDVEHISKLQTIINVLKNHPELYKEMGWEPEELLIDFSHRSITLRDSYLE